MKLFLDTDILLDVLLMRAPQFEASAAVVDWAESHPGRAAVSWHGLANIHYLSENGAEAFIGELIEVTEVPKAGSEHLRQALALQFSDLEDAMQTTVAMLFEAQGIVTRNIRHFEKSPIPAVLPAKIMEHLR